EDNALVHRVGQRFASIAADDDSAFLHHKTGHVAAVAADQERAALHRHAGSRRRVTFDDDRTPPDRPRPAAAGVCVAYPRAAAAGVAVDDQGAAHDRLGRAPAGTAVHFDVRAVHHAGAVIADAPFEDDMYRLEQGDGQVVPAIRLQNLNVALAGFDRLAQRLV